MKYGALAMAVALLVGCDDGRDWKETVPVTGKIAVDGEPTAGVKIMLHPVGEVDTTDYTESTAFTDQQGQFAVSTYQPGDGAPPGDYRLTFELPKLNQLSMQFEGDAFKGRYRDPKKSEFTISVASGDPVDLDTIDLPSK